MSQMERHKGIVKRLSTPKTTKEVYEKLVASGEIDGAWTEFDESGTPTFIDSDKYEMVNGCIFDISDAQSDYDSDEDITEAEKLNDTDYRVHAYFYNGGASFGEILDDIIPEADRSYSDKTIYYAVELTRSQWRHYWTRKGSPTPALFTTENMARSTIRKNTHYGEDEYKIVRFAEI